MSDQTRRTVLRAGAVTAAVTGVVAAVPTASSRAALATSTACTTLTEELTQGPFWVDERLERSDIRADSETGAIRPGIPLTLTINLQDAGAGCAPQVGAYVDIWHADAQGTYSDVSGSGNPDNRGVDWLRGYQVSDENGSVTFTTIWPGWYVGRTIHIHLRVRLTLADDTEVNVTSQLFFDETVSDTVVATSAYQKSGTRTRNATDNLYDAALLVPVTGSTAAGYAGSFTVNLDFGDGTDDGGTVTTPSTGDDTLVDARVVRALAVRRHGRRTVRVVLAADEKVTARLRLVRGDDVLAVRRWGWLPTGRRTLRLRVPRGVTAGRARVLLTLADAAGNTKIVRRPVEVPAR